MSRTSNSRENFATESNPGNDVWRVEVCACSGNSVELNPSARVQTTCGGSSHGVDIGRGVQSRGAPGRDDRGREFGSQSQSDILGGPGE